MAPIILKPKPSRVPGDPAPEPEDSALDLFEQPRLPGITWSKSAVLTNMPTGKSRLLGRHESWLEDAVATEPGETTVIDVFGNASVRGGEHINKPLAQSRADAVAVHIRSAAIKTGNNVTIRSVQGNSDDKGRAWVKLFNLGGSDNDGLFRGADVNVYKGKKPDVEVIPERKFSIRLQQGILGGVQNFLGEAVVILVLNITDIKINITSTFVYSGLAATGGLNIGQIFAKGGRDTLLWDLRKLAKNGLLGWNGILASIIENSKKAAVIRPLIGADSGAGTATFKVKEPVLMNDLLGAARFEIESGKEEIMKFQFRSLRISPSTPWWIPIPVKPAPLIGFPNPLVSQGFLFYPPSV